MPDSCSVGPTNEDTERMSERALVDWGSEDLLPKGRQIDDWTAGDDLDFTVRQRRRRITGEHQAVRATGTDHAAPRARATARTVIVEQDAGAAGRGADRVGPPAPLHAVDGSRDDRRTVSITGRPADVRPAPRLREVEPRRRPSRSPVDQAVSRPDRIALYAVGLGFVLILIAALTGGA